MEISKVELPRVPNRGEDDLSVQYHLEPEYVVCLYGPRPNWYTPKPLSSSAHTQYLCCYHCLCHHVTDCFTQKLWIKLRYGQTTLLLWFLFMRLPSLSMY